MNCRSNQSNHLPNLTRFLRYCKGYDISAEIELIQQLIKWPRDPNCMNNTWQFVLILKNFRVNELPHWHLYVWIARQTVRRHFPPSDLNTTSFSIECNSHFSFLLSDCQFNSPISYVYSDDCINTSIIFSPNQFIIVQQLNTTKNKYVHMWLCHWKRPIFSKKESR